MSTAATETTQPTVERSERPVKPEMLWWLVPAIALAAVFLWLFRGTIEAMMLRWEDPTFSHGWVVAPVSIGIAWYKRESWMGTPVRPSAWGAVIIAMCLLAMVFSVWTDIKFVPNLSMLGVIGGAIVFFGGWGWLKALLFPYAFLLFMVPWPDFLIESISFPLQLWTSIYSSVLANIVGAHNQRDGLSLILKNLDGSEKAAFEVAAACSGIRSMVALMALTSVFAYFTPVALWKRWALFIAGIPIAFFANIIRVFAILCVGYWISPKLAAKAFHDWSSPVLFLVSTILLISVRNLMMREKQPEVAGAVTGGAPSRPVEDDDAF